MEKVFNNHEILSRILEYLPFIDVANFLRVNKLWNQECKRIIRRRSKSLQVEIHFNGKTVTDITKESFHQIDSAFLFCSLDDSPSETNYLPGVNVYSISCMVKSAALACPALNNPPEDGETMRFTGEGVFTISKNSQLKITPFENLSDIDLNDPTLRAIIPMALMNPSKCNKALYKILMGENRKDLAVAGAMCEGFKMNGRSYCGFTISGEKVRAASVVFPQDEDVENKNNLDLVDKSLARLRETNIGHGSSTSFAFVFPCCNRYWLPDNTRLDPLQSHMIRLEFKPFQKQFPNTPMFGFYGAHFECGHDYFGPNDEPPPTKQPRPTFTFGGTTAIVIVDCS